MVDLPDDKARLKVRLLEELRRTGRPHMAMAACGISKGVLAWWKRQDPEFIDAWRAVMAKTNQYLRSPRPHGEKRSQVNYRRFLKELSEGWSVTRAAIAIDVSPNTAYNWRMENPPVELVDECGEPYLDSDGSPMTVPFAEAWALAEEAGTDNLEDEAYRRARMGTDRPVYQGGALAGYVREYSDTLMLALLKGRRPRKFSEKREIYGPGGGPIASNVTINPSEFGSLSIEELAKLYREKVGEVEPG
jgi:hypothetical protein